MHMYQNDSCMQSDVKIQKLSTAEGRGKMVVNNPVVAEEDEEETLGPNI